MAVQITVTVDHLDTTKPTIWNVLKAQLGRNPTNEECKAEIFRILKG